jgi:hypothetical protein
MFLVVPEGSAVAAGDFADLRVKYASSPLPIWEALLARLAAESTLRDAAAEYSVDNARGEAYHAADDRIGNLDRAAGHLLDRIADLAGVDGAVLMTDRFRLLGFGVEVQLESELRDVTIAATQGREGRAQSIEAFGTRHRSAFRFCEAYPAAVAFVLSQDGGVRAALNVDGAIHLWTDVYVGPGDADV